MAGIPARAVHNFRAPPERIGNASDEVEDIRQMAYSGEAWRHRAVAELGAGRRYVAPAR